MTEAELRDHAEDILTAVVEDMSLPQTSDESFARFEPQSCGCTRNVGRLR